MNRKPTNIEMFSGVFYLEDKRRLTNDSSIGKTGLLKHLSIQIGSEVWVQFHTTSFVIGLKKI